MIWEVCRPCQNPHAFGRQCWVRPGYGQLLFYATLLVVMLFNALMTGLTICHVLRKYPVSLRPNEHSCFFRPRTSVCQQNPKRWAHPPFRYP